MARASRVTSVGAWAGGTQREASVASASAVDPSLAGLCPADPAGPRGSIIERSSMVGLRPWPPPQGNPCAVSLYPFRLPRNEVGDGRGVDCRRAGRPHICGTSWVATGVAARRATHFTSGWTGGRGSRARSKRRDGRRAPPVGPPPHSAAPRARNPRLRTKAATAVRPATSGSGGTRGAARHPSGKGGQGGNRWFHPSSPVAPRTRCWWRGSGGPRQCSPSASAEALAGVDLIRPRRAATDPPAVPPSSCRSPATGSSY